MTLHIHWYPGHIAKAERQLKDKLNLVDVVIEVRDARIPLSSSYTNIKKLLGEKPRLLLLNKADLVDKTELKQWVSYLKESTGCPVIVTEAKGAKDLALYTCETNDKQTFTEILQKMKIQYHINNIGSGKVNIFFGSNPCLKIIRGFSSKSLDKLTPYEDFILGIMLGYSRNEQYNRLLAKITPQKTCW